VLVTLRKDKEEEEDTDNGVNVKQFLFPKIVPLLFNLFGVSTLAIKNPFTVN